MNRNTESHFGNIPTKDIRRSKLKMPFRHLTSFNTGDIIPIFHKEVLPGDTMSLNESMVVRMTTPIAPVMDNAWIDTYYFFIPRRLVWEHWQEFMGENNTDAWTQEVERTIPKTTAPEGGWAKGSIASYIGARINTDNIWIDSCYLRAYTLVFNEWFRSENVSEPAEITLTDSDSTGSNGTDYVVDAQLGGMPCKAVKYADYFTRALPSPQKGPDVLLPIGELNGYVVGKETGSGNEDTNLIGLNLGIQKTDISWVYGKRETTDPATFQQANSVIGLGIELDKTTASTINQLRQAFAVQRMAELDARGGTRYIELIASHFGVHSPDARMQRPEYLGGKRVPINIADVTQTSATGDVTPQGNVAGVSKTIDSHDTFTYSATEHGIILGLAVVRTEHTYQQGIARDLTRQKKLDFYFPVLANLGEQYIKNREIYAQGTDEDEEAFGYQEAWAEYRYSNNYVTGELNSDYATPLDIWHYADNYSELPTLSNDWLSETKENVQRTLAIQDQDQWIADFYFNLTAVRPMPVYSIPSMASWM